MKQVTVSGRVHQMETWHAPCRAQSRTWANGQAGNDLGVVETRIRELTLRLDP